MARTFYVVGYNMAGYMPDSETYLARNKKDAISISRENVKMYVDGEEEPYKKHGKDGDYWIVYDAPYRSSIHFWTSAIVLDLVVHGTYQYDRCEYCESYIEEGEKAYAGDGWWVHKDCLG